MGFSGAESHRGFPRGTWGVSGEPCHGSACGSESQSAGVSEKAGVSGACGVEDEGRSAIVFWAFFLP